MQFVKTDGGMRSSGFAESNDCAVRAYALFKDIPYDEAHSIFKKLGRRDGRGTKNHIIYDLVGRTTRKDGAGMTLNQLVAANPTGRVYGMKRGHAFVIINGVLHDSWKVGGKCRITFYWVDNSSVSAFKPVFNINPVRSYTLPVTPAHQYSVESPADKQAGARATFDRLNAYGTLSNYAIAKRIATELNISVANASYYVAKFTGKR
jgi:hypothetical protein